MRAWRPPRPELTWTCSPGRRHDRHAPGSARPSSEGPQAGDLPARVRQARPSMCSRRRRPPPLPAAPGRARADRPGAPNGRAPDQGSALPRRKEPGQLRLCRHPLAQQDPGLGAGPLGIRHPPREYHRTGQQWDRQDPYIALGLGLAACQKGLSVGFTTAAGLVHELLEARDEKRLLRLQRQLAGYKLLIIDELGYVPLSPSGAELLFEVFSQRYERGSTIVTSNLPFDEWTSVFASERLTGALLDRLTHHVHILEMNADSYRLKQSKRRARRGPTEDQSAETSQA